MPNNIDSDARFDRMHRTMNTVILLAVLNSVLQTPVTDLNWLGLDWYSVLLTAFVLLVGVYVVIIVEWVDLPEKIQGVVGDV